MKIVIATDSFKGSLSSIEAGEAIANGVRRALPGAETVVCPIADGGEGTAEALCLGMGGRMEKVTVTGPLGELVEAEYAVIPPAAGGANSSADKSASHGTAVIEMSKAAGLPLVPQDRRNPLYTTTYGVGELIRHAISDGIRHFIVGIGGSATNDGGIGMLQALGYEFLDKSGAPCARGAIGLSELCKIRDEGVISELSECTFRVACDVNNPLCGPDGCSAVYGPQKGAGGQMIADMDRWLSNYENLTFAKYPEKANLPREGCGAAGGLGFAFLAYTGATLEHGIDIILSETHLECHMADADLVITGEGRLDGQSLMGKAPVGVAALAKKYGRPVIALAGSVTDDARLCNSHGIDAFFPIVRGITTLEEAMEPATARENLAATTEQVLRVAAIDL